MVTAQTPGQAFHAKLTAAQAGRFPGYDVVPWDDLDDTFRADIEDAAKDAVEAARLRQREELRAAMAETRELREKLAAMTARWKDQAAMHDRDADRAGNSREAAALSAKSRVYTGNADEVLELIGGQAAGDFDHAAEILRLRAQADAADTIIRDVLESFCRREGLPLESAAAPGEPARNYELADRLGVGHIFGLQLPDDLAGIGE